MFTEKDYEWLKVIECLKKSGLSIKEIRAFIDMTSRGDDSLRERFDLFDSRRRTVEKQIEDMRKTLALLEFKCWYYSRAIEDGTEENIRSMPAEDMPPKYRRIKEQMRDLDDSQL